METFKPRPFNANKVVNFVATNRERLAKGGSIGFSNYTDKVGVFGNPGATVIFNDGTRDRRGNFTGKRFTIDQSHYALQAMIGQKDSEGKTLIDFLKNYPGCEGSPNGTYIEDEDGNITQIGVDFKLADEESDAEVLVEGTVRRAEAQISAGKLDDQTLTEMASYIGEFGPASKAMRSKVVLWAGKRPEDYFRALEEGDRAVRAIVRRSISSGLFKVQGTLIKWEGTVIGENEDAAVAKLIGDPKLLDALQKNADLGTKVESKRSVGRPRKKPVDA